jgi:hypothetical protein
MHGRQVNLNKFTQNTKPKLVSIDEDGKILYKKEFAHCSNQEIAKYDPNGRIFTQFCEEPLRVQTLIGY